MPPPIEGLGNRPFSFYPAIINIEHNEWLYRQATWSEELVVNAKTGEELWIPRRFLGEISSIDDPVVIVGLLKELEYRGGAVWPYQRRVIQMPIAVGDVPRSKPEPARSDPAPVIGIRVESNESRLGRLVGIALACGTAACILVVVLSRGGVLRPASVTFTAKDQSYLDLGRNDDYFSVVQKVGQPAGDRWSPEGGVLQFHALAYPQRAYTVILEGTDRRNAHYIGTLDAHWQPVHAIDKESFAQLRQLKRF